MGRALLLTAVLALAATAGWEPVRAEIYKCVGADGKTLFTSDRSQCPGAEQHQPRGRIEKVPAQPRARTRRPPARSRRSGIGSPAGSEALWRGKKVRAEAELQGLEARLEYMHRAVGWCNRGHALYAENEMGIRRSYDCRDVYNEYEELKARQAGLRLYLEEGLEEECRRAGCLPGWLR